MLILVALSQTFFQENLNISCRLHEILCKHTCPLEDIMQSATSSSIYLVSLTKI